MPHFKQFSAAACETMHVTLCVVAMPQNIYREYPDHPISCLLTTATERNKLSTGCYFFACVVFSPLNMNVFVRGFIVGNVATHMQGFSSDILMIFFEKLCVKCEGI